MTWDPRPLPKITPESAPFWEAAAEGQLLLSECNDCGLVYYYPRAHCPDCFSADVGWLEASGDGEVFSHTRVSSIANWPEEDLPLTMTYVELDEGPRMLTNLVNVDYEDVEIGMAVQVTFFETEREDLAIPRFEPRKD